MALKSIKAARAVPTKEVALRAKEIVNNSFKTDNRNAIHVAPANLQTTSRGWKVTTVTKIPGERARLHQVRVNMPKGYMGKFAKCPEVQIDCDCMRHLFVWNWSLIQKNAAIKDRTNGQPPDITNPGYVPGCCKHGLVAIKSMLAVDPSWPASTIGHPAHPKVGKPITIDTIKQSAEDQHWKAMTKSQKLDWIESHPKSKYAKLANSLETGRSQQAAPKPLPKADAPATGDVNLATVKALKKDHDI